MPGSEEGSGLWPGQASCLTVLFSEVIGHDGWAVGQAGELAQMAYGSGNMARPMWSAQCPPPSEEEVSRVVTCFPLLPGAGAVMASVS